MEFEWEVSDGYVGGTRPHTVTIPDDELEGLSAKRVEDPVYEYVQDEFLEEVTWAIIGRRSVLDKAKRIAGCMD